METPNKLKTVQVLLTTPDYDWERVGFWVNEGPAVIKRDGKIFLTYSASETGAPYCMGMLTADSGADLLDPLSWKKSAIQCWHPTLRSKCTARGTILLPWMRMETIFSCITPARRA